jgi:hypothetical protein
MMEYWNTGILEYWNTGILEYWNTGTLDDSIIPIFHHSMPKYFLKSDIKQ